MKKLCASLTAMLLVGGLSTAVFADHNKNEASMRGTINKIDHSTGKIELKTDKGTSELYFTPDSIKNLKEGEQVVLELETPGHEAMEKHAMGQKH
jgi:uncharacterized cupredoxin-like copper-binding protein